MRQAFATPSVMAGLVPAIHVKPSARKDVDARDKPGHDGGESRGQQLLPGLWVPACFAGKTAADFLSRARRSCDFTTGNFAMRDVCMRAGNGPEEEER